MAQAKKLNTLEITSSLCIFNTSDLLKNKIVGLTYSIVFVPVDVYFIAVINLSK